MGQRPALSDDLALFLPRRQANTDQPGDLGAGEPSLARRPARRQNDPHVFPVKPLKVMMGDGGSQILEIAPGAAARAFLAAFRLLPALAGAPVHIFSAERPGDFFEGPVAEELEQAAGALCRLVRTRLSGRHVIQIDGDDVGDQDLRKWTLAPGWRVFRGDVFGEPLFSLSAFARAASSAN